MPRNSPRLALFVPCFVDQVYPRAAIAAMELLGRLGVNVDVPAGAACCGQPPANAGFERDALPVLRRFVRTYAVYDRVIVLSGSCASHLRAHAPAVDGDAGSRVGSSVVELCAFLHDEVGLPAIARLGATLQARVGVHIGCHALRGLGLARPSEIQLPDFDKVRALLATVGGLEIVQPARRDECCGFGGTYSVTEPELSTRMGRDRLRDFDVHGAEMLVSTDMSCLMHLHAVARHSGRPVPVYHVAEVLAGRAEVA